MTIREIYSKYIEYLKVWADTHSGDEFVGQSPVCFDEFADNDFFDEVVE